MTGNVLTRRDRAVGIALLIASIVLALVPRFQVAGRPIDVHLVAMAWFGAAILLLSMDAVARPMPRLIRWAAAVLFITGIAGPFIANFINLSLGA